MRQYAASISVILVSVLVIGGYLYINKDPTEPVILPSQEVVQGPSMHREVPAGAREYRSDIYGFSVLYPEAMAVREFQESGGAVTIVFEDIKNVRGFQIYIAPYSGSQVSEERIKQDIPSGIIKNKEDFQLNGVLATAFYSQDADLGETREVWFIYKGHLFEITTLKPLESMLLEVLNTWQFMK